MRKLINFFVCVLPWGIRRVILNRIYGYQIAEGAYIGWAYVFPRHLSMAKGSKIGHLSVVLSLDELRLAENSSIGRLNWITAFPSGTGSRHFSEETTRAPKLILGANAAVTNRHIIDCSNSVIIGSFSTFAGFRSQILTHSIDLKSNRQTTAPVEVGDYCFVGTSCIFLPGSRLPNGSVLAAGSVLVGSLDEANCIYGGVPARKIKLVDINSLYFSRKTGYVW